MKIAPTGGEIARKHTHTLRKKQNANRPHAPPVSGILIVMRHPGGCNEIQPAGLVRRLAAMAYDSLILVAIWFLATALLLPFTGGEAIAPGSPAYLLWLVLWGFGWLGWCWTRNGQTPGLRAWRIRLITADGRTPSWGRAALRFLVAIPALLSILGLLWALWEPRKRTWYDLAAGTWLVRSPPPA